MQQPHLSNQMMRIGPLLLTLILGVILAGAETAQAASTSCTSSGITQTCTVTFTYIGAPESWTAPAGVTSATFDLYGARGSGLAGRGGRVTATLAVTPGATYQIRVGGSGGYTPGSGTSYNGGGRAGTGQNISGGRGGGASDVRSGAFGLADRLLVAGGGGGGRAGGTDDTALGGAGGYPNGGAGSGSGGGGGTQTAGGAGGYVGGAGSLGQGGAGQDGNPNYREEGGGSGGGGGYYGGGGAGIGIFGMLSGGGGGGSSYATPAATNVSFESGVRFDDGLVIISYSVTDSSAPVANPTQSPEAAPSGWNNTNVTVTWNWTDPVSGAEPVAGIDPANCTTSSVSSGSGTINLSATCRDLAGNVGTATYQVRVDPTAPTAPNPSQSPAANAAGWNNSDVTVTWNWTFTGAIIDTANCTTSSASSGEGILTLSATCRDVATNQRTVTYQVRVDKTAPVVTVTGVSNGESYTLGSAPAATCNTMDALSGVANQATATVTGGNSDGTGNFTAVCSGATDLAGNNAAPVSVSYSVSPDVKLITIIEDSTPKSTQNFNFNAGPPTPLLNGGNEGGALGAFMLDDAAPSDNDFYSKQRSFLLPNGTYNFSETPPSNWRLKAIECTVGDGSSVHVTLPDVAITLGGGDVTCTFKNELSVTIQTLNYQDSNGNGVRNAGEPALVGWQITATLQPTGTPAYGPLTTNSLGRANFNFIPAGTYKVCEVLTDGWVNTQPGGAAPCYTLTLTPGQTASVNFGNKPAAFSSADQSQELAPFSPYAGVTIVDGDPNAFDGYAVDWAGWVEANLLSPAGDLGEADIAPKIYLPVVVR